MLFRKTRNLAIVNGILADKAHIIIGVVALVRLFASLMINESYIKIVPYLRIIYLDNRVVAYYLLANTVAPFFLYVFFSRLIVSDTQAIQNILLVCLLLLNNILFAHILHMFSFSIKDTMVFYPVILGIYLIVLLRINFFVMPVTTAVSITLFLYKIKSY